MAVLRRLVAVLGLVLTLSLVAGTTHADAATPRQRAQAAVAKATKAVKAARADVAAARTRNDDAQLRYRRAVAARDAARVAYDAAEARRQAAAAEVPAKQAAYDTVAAEVSRLVEERNSYFQELDGAELGARVAQDILDREKDKWAACTRSSGSFQCKKTQNAPFEPAPEVERRYQERERAQARLDRVRATMAEIEARIAERSAQAQQVGAVLDAALAVLNQATNDTDWARIVKTQTEGDAVTLQSRFAQPRQRLAAAEARLAKAKTTLRKAKARLRALA